MGEFNLGKVFLALIFAVFMIMVSLALIVANTLVTVILAFIVIIITPILMGIYLD